MNSKSWVYKDIDVNCVNKLVNEYNMSEISATIMQNRLSVLGNDLEKLNKTVSQALYNPFLLKDMQRAVDRIKIAIENKEHITIYGDYDADGVTSTAILFMYLKENGAIVDYYIPDRITEGYGVNKFALDVINNKGTNLIITVDTGITAIDEVSYAYKLGMDVIVTDHHECKENVPICAAVIDPKQSDCTYPFKELAGVGVVFKLISALNGNEIKSILKKYMSLVCLGSIADVAPLIDENRAFVKLGLRDMENCENSGIAALIAEAGLEDKKITAGNIGFVIAPRINAAGRLGSAYKSLELFLCNDFSKAKEIASELSEENKNRQNIEQVIFDEAINIIEKDELKNDNVIVIANSGWHHGIIGIVSSKITEKYYKPSILLSIEGSIAKGSGRSIGDFNLFDALTNVSDTVVKFGGHCLAAGLTLETDNISLFREKINQYAKQVLKSEDFIPKLYIDCILKKEYLSLENIDGLRRLEPYGMGNPTPIFTYLNSKIKLITTMKDGKHIRMLLEKDGIILSAVGFNMGEFINQYKISDMVDVACCVEINTFREEQKIQLLLKDIKLSHKR